MSLFKRKQSKEKDTDGQPQSQAGGGGGHHHGIGIGLHGHGHHGPPHPNGPAVGGSPPITTIQLEDGVFSALQHSPLASCPIPSWLPRDPDVI
ncbi:hypothetical protein CI109_102837 [Kwoniella shandongensis]|uniref:Uncharacterized protein n=1 Tax=Kwoniella shandongensis TaxID=1734106 RepID=A0AAJ8MWX5_9TREE